MDSENTIPASRAPHWNRTAAILTYKSSIVLATEAEPRRLFDRTTLLSVTSHIRSRNAPFRELDSSEGSGGGPWGSSISFQRTHHVVGPRVSHVNLPIVIVATGVSSATAGRCSCRWRQAALVLAEESRFIRLCLSLVLRSASASRPET